MCRPFPSFLIMFALEATNAIFVIVSSMAMALLDEVLSSESSDDDPPLKALRSRCSTEAGRDAGDDNPASSISYKPVHTLESRNAKERKVERSRQRKLGKKCIGPAGANPPPQLCNRAGSPWHDAPYPCECEKWPKWISEAPLWLCKSKKTGTGDWDKQQQEKQQQEKAAAGKAAAQPVEKQIRR